MTRKSIPFSFTNDRGETLSAILDRPEGAPAFLGVFGPCFTCPKESHGASKICRALADGGAMMLRFDPSGTGASAGTAHRANFTTRVRDMAAAVFALEAAEGPVRLLAGHSLSGTAALSAARLLPGIAVVATVGSPADPQGVVAKFRRQGILRETGAGTVEINVLGRIHAFDASFVDDMLAQGTEKDTREIARRLFVFHAPHDDIVDFENAKTIVARAGSCARLVPLDAAATHLFEKRPDDAVFVAQTLLAAFRSL